MIIKRTEFEEKLVKLHQEVSDFIDALDISSDNKRQLRMQLNSFDVLARSLWNYDHPHREENE